LHLRWRERHQAYFEFSHFKPGGTRDVLIDAPPIFSRCIQEMPDTGTWHFPQAGVMSAGATARDANCFACVKRLKSPT